MTTCACGRNLRIWKNPWNHSDGCTRVPIETAEQRELRVRFNFFVTPAQAQDILAALNKESA